VKSIVIGGHHAFVTSGPQHPRSTSVYWKPASGYLLTAGGYKLSPRMVLRAVRHVTLEPPGTISLPVVPGPIVSRNAAEAAATRSAQGPLRQARAKLSSWTEVATLSSAHTMRDAPAAPAPLRAAPWRPVWVVLADRVLVIDAANSRIVATIGRGARTTWFAALTDRDPAAASGCPGGSSARLPFGVLTRTEERYAAAPAHWPSGTETRLVLSTVAAVNRADPGMYGGCVLINCSVRELVWVTITTERARPGHTLQCLPPSVSVPAGYRPRQVKETFSVDVPDNAEVGCGPVPGPFRDLKDLAPSWS
jgi:hypothetical protein